MTRHCVFVGAVALVAVAWAGIDSAGAQSIDETPTPRTFVLVPGAWLGSWAFEDVTSILRDNGHRVFPVTLSGLADRSHLDSAQVTLNTHIEDIVNVIRFNELDNVVLVGHSYGGMAITGAADRISDRIDALIYLDALVPSDGQAAIDLMDNEFADAINSAQEAGEDSIEFLVPVPLPPEIRWRFAPQPIKSFIEPIRLTGASGEIPSKTYVRATGPGPDFTHIVSGLESKSDWRIVELDAEHNMMIDAPVETAALLEQFAR